MRTATDDDLDAFLSGDPDPETPANDDAVPEDKTEHFVCDYIDPQTKEVCGVSFDTKAKLNGHVTGKHRDRSGDKKPSRDSVQPKGAPRRAAAKVEIVPTDRVPAYTQSIAMFGLGAHVAVPGFDAFDLDCVTKGAPGLAAGLAAVGEKHTAIQQACDLVLGGGTAGGAYVQLLLATMAMFAPIAAHHGWLPDTVGERFGAVIGVAAPVVTVPPSSPPPAQGDDAGAVPRPHPDPTNPEDVLAFMTQVPESVMFDIASKAMSMGGPIGVTVPGTFDIPDRSPNGVGPDATISAAESPDSPEG